MLQGSFKAPEDLTLRQVIFTTSSQFGFAQQTNAQVLSLDPDLTIPAAEAVSQAFQLTFISDLEPGVSIASSMTFKDLAFPLLKGQTLYWGGSGVNDLIQLIFS